VETSPIPRPRCVGALTDYSAAVDDREQSGSGSMWRREWDAFLVLGPVALLAVLTLTVGDSRSRNGVLATLVLVVLPLIARRRWPIPVFVVVAFGATVTSTLFETPWIQILAVVLASATVGEAATDRSRSLAAIVLVGALMTLGFLAQGAQPVQSVVLPFVFLLPSWLLGDLLRARRLEAARREEVLQRSLREREQRIRAAAAEERRHVARELHDVVAHAVSVMVVQAGAARQVVHSSPDRAEESLLAIEATGREAMTELRRFLGALDDDEAGGLAPQPGIDSLPRLVDRVREAGLPASLEVDGERRAVSASLDVTVYRIVQEALTNALRYARQASTIVRLSWDVDQLRVEVLDDGPATAAAVEGATGRGLIGIRDRAALVGGRVEVGPRLGGGYAVRAWLPLEPGRPPEAALT
jgi:signal transduction histidine kinase